MKLALSALTILGSGALVIIFAAIPRWYYKRLLQQQLEKSEGYVFSPEKGLWAEIVSRRSALALPLLLLVYGMAVLVLLFTSTSLLAVQVTLAVGCYLLLYNLFAGIPPVFGVTSQGITILSWQPKFPLAPHGSGSLYVPWQKVSVCEIGEQYFTALTEKVEALVVYPAELEDQVCAFVDVMLREQGYQVE